MKIDTGNTNQESKKYKGWIVGHFLEQESILKNKDVEVKWINRKKEQIKEGTQKDCDGTIAILISGKYKTTFPTIPNKVAFLAE